MADLKGATVEELTAELERRKAIDDPTPSPKTLALVDWSGVYNTTVSGISDAIANEGLDEDLKNYIYESAVTAIYGDGYWTWRRKQPW